MNGIISKADMAALTALAGGNQAKRRILIVEDNQDISELLAIRLGIAGYATAIAATGREALALFDRFDPHAILLDIGLPDGDGFEVLGKLAKFQPMVPVLMLTARQGMEDVKRALSMGAKDYVTKPFDDQKLLMRVARLFGGITIQAQQKIVGR